MSKPEVECITLEGKIKKVPRDRLILRPAAYAIIVQNGKILLVKMRHSGKFHLPGGGVQKGERLEETLKRETWEETGIEIAVERFAHFEEAFFYYDPSKRAYHGLHFYFICRPKTLDLLADDQVNDGSAEQPRWVEIRDLHPADFQIHGDIILKLCTQTAEQKMKTFFTISPDDVRIAYDTCGAGPAIMLLHGGGSNRQDWHEGGYVERLRNDFKVITVDLRGHGESEWLTDPACYSTEKMGQDLLSVADACGVEQFTIWGFSFGGNVGRYLAARSERVARMVLIGTRLGNRVAGEWRKDAEEFRKHWEPIVRAQMGSDLKGTFDPGLLSQEDQDELKRRELPGKYVPALLAWSGAMLAWEVIGPADLRCPTLWLFGSENQNALDSYKKYEEEIKGSRVQVHIIEGFTHMQEFEEIDRVFPIMLAFSKA